MWRSSGKGKRSVFLGGEKARMDRSDICVNAGWQAGKEALCADGKRLKAAARRYCSPEAVKRYGKEGALFCRDNKALFTVFFLCAVMVMGGFTLRRVFGPGDPASMYRHILHAFDAPTWWGIRRFVKDVVFTPFLMAFVALCILRRLPRAVRLGWLSALPVTVLSGAYFYLALYGQKIRPIPCFCLFAFFSWGTLLLLPRIKTFVLAHKSWSFLIYISALCLTVGAWVRLYFGPCSVEQALFHIMMSRAGMDQHILEVFIIFALILPAVLAGTVIGSLSPLEGRRGVLPVVGLVLGIGGMAYLGTAFYGYDYVWARLHTDMPDFYEGRYARVEPSAVGLDRPRNLVLLYLESVESLYARVDVFGANLLPRLSALREREAGIRDARQLAASSWTIAGMLSSLCAVPLSAPVERNSMGRFGEFLPGAVCLTDVLDEHGYELRFIQGSDRTFAGKDKFFTSHHVPPEDVLDYQSLVARDPESAQRRGTGWGLRDRETYRHAREEIEALAREGKPFAAIVLSVDTHQPDGYLDPLCPAVYGDFRDVVVCADDMAADFLEWIAAQPFADDTMVVVMGDHLAMVNPLYDLLAAHQDERRNFNLFINPARPLPDAERRVSHLDMLPTMLEALGGTVPGGRMGLGVSLYSGEPTLLELMDAETLDGKLRGHSEIYNALFVPPAEHGAAVAALSADGQKEEGAS